MNVSLFLRGVFVLIAAAAAGGAVPSAGGSTPGVVGRIFFSSNRAPDLNPQLFTVSSEGTGRKQLTSPLGAFDSPDWSPMLFLVRFVVPGFLMSGLALLTKPAFVVMAHCTAHVLIPLLFI